MTSCPRSFQARPPTSSRASRASAAALAAAEHAERLDDAEFAARLEALGPFERPPRLAVAVSGGPDSLALCLLADSWARAKGGTVVGLIVDHGLRAGSATEARRVADWLAARKIERVILTWRGPKPSTGIQAAARAARYRLLESDCRARDVLHLLVGHQRNDQAETVALRAARGSGPDGLAGMAAVRELKGCRVLRPLLDVGPERLVATLMRAGQPWLDDPSNRSPAFARARLRLAGGLDAAGLTARAAASAARRSALDGEVAGWLVAHARIDPAGYVSLDAAALACATADVRHRAVQQTLRCVGGRPYPPRQARLRPLLQELRAGLARGRTLAGCRILPASDRLLVCREAGTIDHVASLADGEPLWWDRRFWIEAVGNVTGTEVRALGEDGEAALRKLGRDVAGREMPPPVRPGLPSVWHGKELLAVPACGWSQAGFARHARVVARFRPVTPLAGAPFAGSGGRLAGADTVASRFRALMLS